MTPSRPSPRTTAPTTAPTAVPAVLGGPPADGEELLPPRGVPAASGNALDEIAQRWAEYHRLLEEHGHSLRDLDPDWAGASAEMWAQHRDLARRRALAASDTTGDVAAALARFDTDLAWARREQNAVHAALGDAVPGSDAELSGIERLAALRAFVEQVADTTADVLRDAAAHAPRTSLFTHPNTPWTVPPEIPDTPAKLLDPPATPDTLATSNAAAAPARPPTPTTGDATPDPRATPQASLPYPPPADGISPITTALLPQKTGPRPTATTNNPNHHDGGEGGDGGNSNSGGDDGGGGMRRRRWVIVREPTGDGIHDTLSRIAERELGSAELWPSIYELNKGRPQPRYGPLHDPNLIYPGETLEVAAPATHPHPPPVNPPDPPDPPDLSGPVRPGPTAPVHTRPGHAISSEPGVLIGGGLAAALVTVGFLAYRATRRATPGPRLHEQASDRPEDALPPPTIRRLADALTHPDPPRSRPTTRPTTPRRPRASNPRTTTAGVDPFTTTPHNPYPYTDTDARARAHPHNRYDTHRHDPPENTPRATPDTARDTVAGRPPGEAPRDCGADRPHAGTHDEQDSTAIAGDGLIRELGIRAHHNTSHTEVGGSERASAQTVVVDLAALTGLGLRGPTALDALRALLVDLLTPATPEHPVQPADVLIPAADARTLLGVEPDPTTTDTNDTGGGVADQGDDGDDAQTPPRATRLPAGLRIVEDLPAALDELEIQIHRRLREHLSGTGHRPHRPLVLITRLDPEVEAHGDPRLQAVLDLGGPLGVAAVLAGSWAAGTTCHLDTTATITHASGPAGLALRHTRMHTLPTPHALDALHVLAHHNPHDEPGADEPDPKTHDTPPEKDDDAQHPDDGEHGATDPEPDPSTHPEPATRPQPPPESEATAATDVAGEPDRARTTTHTPQPHTGQDDPAPPRPRTDSGAGPGGGIDEANDAGDDDTPEPAAQDTATQDTQGPHGDHGSDHHGGGGGDGEGRNAVAGTTPLPAAHPDTRPGRAENAAEAGAPPTALIVVRAFGRLQVSTRATAGAELVDVTARLSPTQRLLLACLAARTGPIPAETLIDTCWARSPADNAAAKLHTAIYRLRASLRHAIGDPEHAPPLLVHVADSYTLDPAHCWVDHHALYSALREARTATTPTAQADALRHAVALHTGPLLEGTENIDWLDPIRTHARRTTITAAATLADDLSHTDPEQAVHYLTAALVLDPTDEPTARALIHHQLALNRHAAAERTYTTLVTELADLGTQPEHATTRLLHPPPPAPRPPATSPRRVDT